MASLERHLRKDRQTKNEIFHLSLMIGQTSTLRLKRIFVVHSKLMSNNNSGLSNSFSPSNINS